MIGWFTLRVVVTSTAVVPGFAKNHLPSQSTATIGREVPACVKKSLKLKQNAWHRMPFTSTWPPVIGEPKLMNGKRRSRFALNFCGVEPDRLKKPPVVANASER